MAQDTNLNNQPLTPESGESVATERSTSSPKATPLLFREFVKGKITSATDTARTLTEDTEGIKTPEEANKKMSEALAYIGKQVNALKRSSSFTDHLSMKDIA